MTEAIRGELEVSLLKLQNALLKADAQTKRADEAQAKVSARVQRVLDRVKLAQAEVAQLEASGQRAFTKLGKQLGRSLGTLAIGTALTEIGIPEAAQPLVKIGTAALAGAQFGGLAGAAGFATVAMFMELLGAVKALDRRQEALKSHVLQFRQEQAAINREIQRDRAREERERNERFDRVREDARKEVQASLYRARRFDALGLR